MSRRQRPGGDALELALVLFFMGAYLVTVAAIIVGVVALPVAVVKWLLS